MVSPSFLSSDRRVATKKEDVFKLIDQFYGKRKMISFSRISSGEYSSGAVFFYAPDLI